MRYVFRTRYDSVLVTSTGGSLRIIHNRGYGGDYHPRGIMRFCRLSASINRLAKALGEFRVAMESTRTMQDWLDGYGESHQNSLNKAIHWIAVPLIFLTIVGLLWSFPLPDALVQSSWINLATLMLIPVFLFYVRLSVPLTVGMMVWCLFCIGVCYAYESNLGDGYPPLWQSSVVVFVLAWIGQFYGHRVEGQKPSFFEDLQYLMIGPAWLMSFIYNKLGIKY